MEEIGPDLRFDDDKKRRTHNSQSPANSRSKIERAVEDAIHKLSNVPFRHCASRDCGGRKINGSGGLHFPKELEQGYDRSHFTDRNGVQPEGAQVRPFERAGWKAEALT